MIDGMWWLVILLAIVIILWLIAKSRSVKAIDGRTSTTLNSPEYPTNDALQKTLKLIKKQFPNYQVTRKANHLLISENNKKVAMITMDKKLVKGQRLLGEVTVINYHSAPSIALLNTDFESLR